MNWLRNSSLFPLTALLLLAGAVVALAGGRTIAPVSSVLTHIAVSYTHLDVYKRQAFQLRGGIRVRAGRLRVVAPGRMGANTLGRNHSGYRRSVCPLPVSYTHLDVYKRQASSMSIALTRESG